MFTSALGLWIETANPTQTALLGRIASSAPRFKELVHLGPCPEPMKQSDPC